MTTLTVRADLYKLKYNETANQLKDLTWENLKDLFGKGEKIICPCMNREYNITQSFIASHMKTKKHRDWVETEQKQYTKEYGHIGNSEDIINKLYKQLREDKVMYYNLNNTKNVSDKKLEKTENENNRLLKIIEALNHDNNNYKKTNSKNLINNKQLKENIESKNTENEILLLEIKSLDEYIQKINLLLEIKSLENDIKTTKSNIFIKKRKIIKNNK